MARRRRGTLRYAFLAVVISMALWSIAHGGSTVEREFDNPVVFTRLPEDLVIPDQSATKINVRVQGSRAAFRALVASELEYVENVGGAKPGRARYEVDTDRLDLPRGVQPVGLSPAQIDVQFELRSRKNVPVRADLQGTPPEGYQVGEVAVEPARVWLIGARSRVLRLSEVLTEPIDLSELRAPSERDVKLALGSDHVWLEGTEPVKVKIEIQPTPPAARPRAGGRTG
jgi:YbbR domain-containing protein